MRTNSKLTASGLKLKGLSDVEKMTMEMEIANVSLKWANKGISMNEQIGVFSEFYARLVFMSAKLFLSKEPSKRKRR